MEEVVEVGDTIRLLLDNPTFVFSKIEGRVVAIFDALTASGEEGINLEIDIKFGINNEAWFRYKPAIDKGNLTIIKKGTNANRF
jgi:hypothetical protein